MLLDGLAGVVGERWARAFLQFYSDKKTPFSADEILESYAKRRSTVKQWLSDASLDLVAASLESLKVHLKSRGNYEALLGEILGGISCLLRDVRFSRRDLPISTRVEGAPP